jgi:hypothetical protein
MQTDDDVGKVAAPVPVIICILSYSHLFMSLPQFTEALLPI